jgi:hypothetical protein
MQVTFKVRNVSGLFFLGIISGFITGLSIQLPTFRSTELFPFCAIVFSTIMALYATVDERLHSAWSGVGLVAFGSLAFWIALYVATLETIVSRFFLPDTSQINTVETLAVFAGGVAGTVAFALARYLFFGKHQPSQLSLHTILLLSPSVRRTP